MIKMIENEALEKRRWKSGNELLEEAIKRQEVEKKNDGTIYKVYGTPK